MADSGHYVKSTKPNSTRAKGNLSLQFVNCPAQKSVDSGRAQMASYCFGRANRFGLSPAQIIVDLAIFCLVAVPVGFYFFVLPPHHLGFFCDDDSIRYPYHPDTISTTLLLIVGLAVPTGLMLCVELFNKRRKKLVFGSSTRILDAFKGEATFLFGCLVNVLLVEVAKTSLGRLRPHFIDVCQPDWSKINCSEGYIVNYECTNTKAFSATTLKDSHLSFPSGHAAFGSFCALFSIYYLQLRFRINQTELLKPALQLTLAMLAFYCGVSRVMDFKHHPSDVIGGAIIGCLIASVIFFKLTVPVMRPFKDTLIINQNNNRRPQFHHLDSVMTNISSCPSDMGSYQGVSDESPDPSLTTSSTPTPLIAKDNMV